MKANLLNNIFESTSTAERIFETFEAIFATAATCVIGSMLSFIGGNIAGALSVLIF